MSKIDITNLTSSHISELNTDETNHINGGTGTKKCGFIGGFAGSRRAFKSLGCGVGIGSAVSISAPAIETPVIETPVIETPALNVPSLSATACIDGKCETTTINPATH